MELVDFVDGSPCRLRHFSGVQSIGRINLLWKNSSQGKSLLYASEGSVPMAPGQKASVRGPVVWPRRSRIPLPPQKRKSPNSGLLHLRLHAQVADNTLQPWCLQPALKSVRRAAAWGGWWVCARILHSPDSDSEEEKKRKTEPLHREKLL